MMAETQEVNFDAPVRKPRKPRARSAAPAQPAAPYPGLTRASCADGCSAASCAISLKPYCAHPTKGGLHPKDKQSPAALQRSDAAAAALARDAVETDISKRKR